MSDRYDPEADANRTAAAYVDRWFGTNPIRAEDMRRDMATLACTAYRKGIEYAQEPAKPLYPATVEPRPELVAQTMETGIREGWDQALGLLQHYANAERSSGAAAVEVEAINAAHAYLTSRRPQ